MKKPLLLFMLFVILLVLAKVAYTKYCTTKVEGCKESKYEDDYLTNGHMDSKG